MSRASVSIGSLNLAGVLKGSTLASETVDTTLPSHEPTFRLALAASCVKRTNQNGSMNGASFNLGSGRTRTSGCNTTNSEFSSSSPACNGISVVHHWNCFFLAKEICVVNGNSAMVSRGSSGNFGKRTLAKHARHGANCSWK